jgi:hypothetical protein
MLLDDPEPPLELPSPQRPFPMWNRHCCNRCDQPAVGPSVLHSYAVLTMNVPFPASSNSQPLSHQASDGRWRLFRYREDRTHVNLA